MNWLIGVTGRSFLDVWSIAHLAFWLFVGSAIWPFVKEWPWPPRLIPLSICLFWALAWEVFEKVAEDKWPNLWLSPESWLNSWGKRPTDDHRRRPGHDVDAGQVGALMTITETAVPQFIVPNCALCFARLPSRCWYYQGQVLCDRCAALETQDATMRMSFFAPVPLNERGEVK